MMDAMMQQDQKVKNLLIFLVTKLGLLQRVAGYTEASMARRSRTGERGIAIKWGESGRAAVRGREKGQGR